MKKAISFAFAAIAALTSGMSLADTLELYDGTILEAALHTPLTVKM